MKSIKDIKTGLECCKQSVDSACDRCTYKANEVNCIVALASDALDCINEQETVRAEYVECLDGCLAEIKDRLEIVRCADCKHWQTPFDTDDKGCLVAHCDLFSESEAFSARFYCAHGERRKSE